VILRRLKATASWRTHVFPRLRYPPLAADARLQHRPGFLAVPSDPSQPPCVRWGSPPWPVFHGTAGGCNSNPSPGSHRVGYRSGYRGARA
jgi:hypothetical protein